MEQLSSTAKTYSKKLSNQTPQGATGTSGTSGVSGSTGSSGTIKAPVKVGTQVGTKPAGTATKPKTGGKMSRSEFEHKTQSFINEALEMAKRGGRLVKGVITAAETVSDIVEDVTGLNEPQVVRTFPLPKPLETGNHPDHSDHHDNHAHHGHPHNEAAAREQVTEHHTAFHQPQTGFSAVEITLQQQQQAQQPAAAAQNQAFAGYPETPIQQQNQQAQQQQFCNVNNMRRTVNNNRGRPVNNRYANNFNRRMQRQRPCPPTSAVCECCPQPAPVTPDCGCDDPSKKNI